jgi:hypothetical protein
MTQPRAARSRAVEPCRLTSAPTRANTAVVAAESNTTTHQSASRWSRFPEIALSVDVAPEESRPCRSGGAGLAVMRCGSAGFGLRWRAGEKVPAASVQRGWRLLFIEMPLSRPTRTRASSRLFTTFAIFATVVQLVVALAPLGEGRIARALSAHVESGGRTGHVAHNEATCPSCQARSIHGTTSRPVAPLPDALRGATVSVVSVSHSVATGLRLHSNPRAPPAVI